MIFQILDWSWNHEEDGEGKKYVINLFGREKDFPHKSVYVKVNNYTPFFYIEMPNNWRDCNTDLLIVQVKELIGKYEYWKGLEPGEIQEGLKEVKKVKDRSRLYGFNNFENSNFLQLIFKDYASMKGSKDHEKWLKTIASYGYAADANKWSTSVLSVLNKNCK